MKTPAASHQGRKKNHLTIKNQSIPYKPHAPTSNMRYHMNQIGLPFVKATQFYASKGIPHIPCIQEIKIQQHSLPQLPPWIYNRLTFSEEIVDTCYIPISHPNLPHDLSVYALMHKKLHRSPLSTTNQPSKTSSKS